MSEQNSDKVTKKYHLLHTKYLDVDSLDGTRSNQSKESKDPKQTTKKEGEKQPKTGSQSQSHDMQPLFLEVDHLVEIGSLPLTDFPGSPIKGMPMSNRYPVNSPKDRLTYAYSISIIPWYFITGSVFHPENILLNTERGCQNFKRGRVVV